jgi:hypothetical protein
VRFYNSDIGDITLWPYRPAIPYNEAYEWFNFVQDSYDGKNFVTRLRNAPRHVIEIESPINKRDINNAYQLLYQYKTEIWGVPSWADYIDVSVSAGATTLPFGVDQTIPWVIIKDQYQAELLFFNGGTFDALQDDYINSIVAPLRIGRIVTDANTFNNTLSGRASFTFLSTQNKKYVPDAPAQYKGNDVYTDTCSIFDNAYGIQEAIVKRMDEVDSVNGLISFNSPWECPRRVRQYRLFNNTRTGYQTYKDFLFRRAGRYSPFWIPTWNGDLTLKSTGSLTTTILIEESGYSSCRADIAVRRTNGDWLFREVTGATLVGDDIQLTLNSSLGIDASDVAFISYLGLHRLGTDRVEIGHITNTQSTSALSIVESDITPITVSCA